MRDIPPVVYVMRVSAAAGQLSAAGTANTKQQNGRFNPHEVKAYCGCEPHEVNVLYGYHPQAVKVLRVPPIVNKLRLVRVEPAAGETYFLRGALEPHTWHRSMCED